MYVYTHVLYTIKTHQFKVHCEFVAPLRSGDYLHCCKNSSTNFARFFSALSVSSRVFRCLYGATDGSSDAIICLPIQDFGYALEFHLPYYALRQGDVLRADPRGLRRSGYLIPNDKGSPESQYLYEAQLSLMVTGVDEWFWTAYFCAETHFGSEESIQYYHKNQLDALTGGEKSIRYPVWNPREYFLSILSRRLKQVAKEWSNIVESLEDRLRVQVGNPSLDSAHTDTV